MASTEPLFEAEYLTLGPAVLLRSDGSDHETIHVFKVTARQELIDLSNRSSFWELASKAGDAVCGMMIQAWEKQHGNDAAEQNERADPPG